jgi:hypothetical protein
MRSIATDSDRMRYTIRNIPDSVDTAARTAARTERQSLNTVLVQALERGFGLTLGERRRDLSYLATGPPLEPEVLRALAEQRQLPRKLSR